MLQFIIYLILIISVAMATGSIILVSKLRARHNHEIFSTLLYYEVFIYTFGFYGIWGQVLIKAFLTPYISIELITKFTNIALFLGLPFLVFGWLMLIRLACEISGRKCAGRVTMVFLLINFTILAIAGYLLAKKSILEPAVVLKSYFIATTLAYTLSFSYMILNTGRNSSPLVYSARKITASAMFLLCLLLCIPLLFFTDQVYLGIIFILIFFAGNAFIPIYFTYGANILHQEEPFVSASFESFCKKYEVSPRESEIIREICNGLSNKEIADKLFITLQTVKDHTHRIYIKTNVKSRVQLINLIKT